MKKKEVSFIEEFSDNYAVLFVEMFIIRYGEIKDIDEFVNDFKQCLLKSKNKSVRLFTEKVANIIKQ